MELYLTIKAEFQSLKKQKFKHEFPLQRCIHKRFNKDVAAQSMASQCRYIVEEINCRNTGITYKYQEIDYRNTGITYKYWISAFPQG